MKNPYRKPTKTLTTRISDEDWNIIWHAVPVHGIQNTLLSSLLKRFIDLTHNELPKRPNPENERILAALIARLTLAPSDRPYSGSPNIDYRTATECPAATPDNENSSHRKEDSLEKGTTSP